MAREADAQLFRSLHVPGRPLVLFNVWDAGSAAAVAAAGAPAVATGSWSVAAAHGFADGERLPWSLVMANVGRIVDAVRVPVSIDVEGGYGPTAEAAAESVSAVAGLGAVGCNIEDGLGPSDLRTVSDQVERLRHVRVSVDRVLPGFFVNARCDVFLQVPSAGHREAMVADVLSRANAYAEAGADGLFVPGVVASPLIEMLVAGSPLPVNVMAAEASPSLRALSSLGVARVSHGPGPYALAMRGLSKAAAVATGRTP